MMKTTVCVQCGTVAWGLGGMAPWPVYELLPQICLGNRMKKNPRDPEDGSALGTQEDCYR